jgi:hypothetical protein
MWCISAVNLMSLFCFAVQRMRSNSLDTALFRPSVRCVFCWFTFLLVNPLSSTVSSINLFYFVQPLRWYYGVVRLLIIAHCWLRFSSFQHVLLLIVEDDEVSRFSRIEFPYMLEVSDRAGLN